MIGLSIKKAHLVNIGTVLFFLIGKSPAQPLSFNVVMGSSNNLQSIMSAWNPSWAWGLSLFDYNQDGLMDMIATSHNGGGIIIKNTSSGGNFSFVDASAEVGLSNITISADGRPEPFDFNGDGWLDIPGFSDEVTNFSYSNQGGSTFVALKSFSMKPISHPYDIRDINGDGYLDVLDPSHDLDMISFADGQIFIKTSPSKITVPTGIPQAFLDYLGTLDIGNSSGNNRFLRVNYFFPDINFDGIKDVVAKAYGSYGGDQFGRYFIRDANGNLTDETTNLGLPLTGTPILWQDFNSDGHLDFLIARGSAGMAGLYLSGSGTYSRAANSDLNSYLGSSDSYLHRSGANMDFDNDGDHDLIVVSPRNSSNRLYENSGNGVMTEILAFSAWDNEGLISSIPMLNPSNVLDLNADGKLDFIVGGPGNDIRIYMNQSSGSGNYAFIYPRMAAPNVYAVGGEFIFYAAGEAGNASAIPLTRERAKLNGIPLHLGLAGASTFDILAIWPDGSQEIFANVTAGDSVAIRPGEGVTANEESALPNKSRGFLLGVNKPNPFKGQTSIQFQIPQEAKVSLSIYNVQGKLLRLLLNKNLAKGTHTRIWNGMNAQKNKMPAGIYFYRLKVYALSMAEAPVFTAVKPMLLMD